VLGCPPKRDRLDRAVQRNSCAREPGSSHNTKPFTTSLRSRLAGSRQGQAGHLSSLSRPCLLHSRSLSPSWESFSRFLLFGDTLGLHDFSPNLRASACVFCRQRVRENRAGLSFGCSHIVSFQFEPWRSSAGPLPKGDDETWHQVIGQHWTCPLLSDFVHFCLALEGPANCLWTRWGFTFSHDQDPKRKFSSWFSMTGVDPRVNIRAIAIHQGTHAL
jgi:ribosome modulation factor